MLKVFLFSIILLFFRLAVFGQQDYRGLAIIQKPITYDSLRIALSLEYLQFHHGLNQKVPDIIPKMIVVHYTGGGNLKSNFDYFNRSEIESGREMNHKASRLNVSAHFLVDRDGKIYQLLKETLFARHTIGLNYCSIGIENVGGPLEELTEAQAIANIKLIEYLCSKYRIDYLIGHSEYNRFKGTALWKELDPKYINQKSDPGDAFMKKIRNALASYKFKNLPS